MLKQQETAMSIEVTSAELIQAKRAVLVMNDLSKLAMRVTAKSMPLEVKQDILALTKLIKKLDAVAK
jgi:hypothetical protein